MNFAKFREDKAAYVIGFQQQSNDLVTRESKLRNQLDKIDADIKDIE